MGYTLQDFVRMIEKQTEKDDIPADVLVLDYVRFPTDKKIG
jgi:hypothetical protein